MNGICPREIRLDTLRQNLRYLIEVQIFNNSS